MWPIKVSGGIFIDWNCSAVQKISRGWFIPDMGGNDQIDKEYRIELTAFLEKWFKPTGKGSINASATKFPTQA